MASGVNKVIILGNLGKDPESRFTQQGTQITSFTVAVSEAGRKDESGQRGEEKTEWFNVVAWEKLAEVCGQYLHKGSKVYVEGKLQTRSWQDQEGVTKYRTEVVAREMKMLDPAPRSGNQQPTQDDDDLPY